MSQTKTPPNPKPRKTPFHWDLEGVPPTFVWNRLLSLRESAGLSQAELAVHTGLSVVTVYQLEMGHDARTTDSTKEKLADFFGCKVNDIFPVSMVGRIPEREYLKRKLREDKAAGRIPGE